MGKRTRASQQRNRSAVCALRIAVEMPWDASAHMGTGAYSETMVRALAEAAADSRIMVITPEGAPQSITSSNVSYHAPRHTDVRSEGFRQLALPILLEELGIDCLFAPATLLPLVRICPMVMTVHDLTFVEHPEYYSPGLVEYLNRFFGPSLRGADHIVAISQETKTELVGRYKIEEKHVTVIHQPVRETFRTPLCSDEVNKHLLDLGIKRPFFFHVSNLAPHKNLAFAVQAFSRFLASNPGGCDSFVVAGGGVAPNLQPDLSAMAKQWGVEKRVQFVGRVSDDQLKALYQGCTACLFPSLAEGWGLPIAEAYSVGATVLSSPNIPSAGNDDRIPLVVDNWASRMSTATRSPRREPTSEHLSHVRAGNKLMNILKQVTKDATKSAYCTMKVSGQGSAQTQVPDPQMVLEAPWGLGDGLLLSAVSKHVLAHIPRAQIWLGTWPGDLPRPSFIQNGDPPEVAARVKLSYGQPRELALSPGFPGSLVSRMISDLNRQIGMRLPQPHGEVLPELGDFPRSNRRDDTVALMAHGSGMNPAKSWGYDRFSELSRLLKSRGWNVVQIGSTQDKLLPDSRDERSASLFHATRVMTGAALFIGEVGFLMHLAAASRMSILRSPTSTGKPPRILSCTVSPITSTRGATST